MCRTGYPWAEQMSRKLSRKVRERRSSNSRKCPERDSKCWQRIKLGILGLRSWGRNWSRKVRETWSSSSRKRSEADSKCWQRVELDIHCLNRWTVNCLEMSRKRGVQAARNGPSLPPTPAGGPVAKAEMSTADRLGSREGASRGGWREPVGCRRACDDAPAQRPGASLRCTPLAGRTCGRKK